MKFQSVGAGELTMSAIKECSLLMRPIGRCFPYKSNFQLNEVVQFYCQFVNTYQEIIAQDTEGEVLFQAHSQSAKSYHVCNVNGRNIGIISKLHTFSTYWTMSNAAATARIVPERTSQVLEPLAIDLRYVQSGGLFSRVEMLARSPKSDLQSIGIPLLLCGMYIAYANRYWWSVV